MVAVFRYKDQENYKIPTQYEQKIYLCDLKGWEPCINITVESVNLDEKGHSSECLWPFSF